MEQNDLQRALMAVLFAAGEPVDAKRLITTITIGRSLALALHAGVRFLKILNQRKKAV